MTLSVPMPSSDDAPSFHSDIQFAAQNQTIPAVDDHSITCIATALKSVFQLRFRCQLLAYTVSGLHIPSVPNVSKSE